MYTCSLPGWSSWLNLTLITLVSGLRNRLRLWAPDAPSSCCSLEFRVRSNLIFSIHSGRYIPVVVDSNRNGITRRTMHPIVVVVRQGLFFREIVFVDVLRSEIHLKEWNVSIVESAGRTSESFISQKKSIGIRNTLDADTFERREKAKQTTKKGRRWHLTGKNVAIIKIMAIHPKDETPSTNDRFSSPGFVSNSVSHRSSLLPLCDFTAWETKSDKNE